MNRDAFLARVKEAARSGRAYRVPTRDLPADTGYVGGGDDLCASLAAEIEAVGGRPRIVDHDAAARDAVAELLELHNARAALCWQHALLARLQIRQLLDDREVSCVDHASLAPLERAECRERMLAADVGISSVDFAVAETGTLVVGSRPGQERVASLAPPVHIALVDQNQVLPDLLDVFGQLVAAGVESLPSNLAFITGPSKTGDIELQLTTGVHGPGDWHVVIIRGENR